MLQIFLKDWQGDSTNKSKSWIDKNLVTVRVYATIKIFHLSSWWNQLMAKKCMKSSLFSIGVRVGLPRSLRLPISVLISRRTGPSIPRMSSTHWAISSGVTATIVCKQEYSVYSKVHIKSSFIVGYLHLLLIEDELKALSPIGIWNDLHIFLKKQ